VRLAVTGKGGVGKSTLVALLARVLRDAGHRVIAIDADPDMNLAALLGVPDATSITPIIAYKELIAERTGTQVGKAAPLFTMNPRVDDIPERFAVRHNGISLLRMGSLKLGGAGCYCPENAFLKSLVSHLFLGERDVLIMDMEAGVEHFGRGTAQGVDWLLIVLEPTRQSIETGKRIRSLAADIGLTRIGVVGNQCRDAREKEFLTTAVAPLPLLGVLPYDEALRKAEQEGRPPETSNPEVEREIAAILRQLLG